MAAKETIAAEGICKSFGDVHALSDVSFLIEGPQLVGILGPNGAGKTTLLDIIEGLSEPTTGTYRLFGEEPKPYPRKRVGVVMQKEMLLPTIKVKEYAELFASIFEVPSGAQQILEMSRLGQRAATPVSRLSGGEAARLFIAASVVHNPELLLLDEPTAALDPTNKRAVGAVLKEMAKERTVVMTTHDLREADALCDYLLFMVNGQVRAAGARAQLIEAVPQAERLRGGVEDAFFHFCEVRIRGGEVEADQ